MDVRPLNHWRRTKIGWIASSEAVKNGGEVYLGRKWFRAPILQQSSNPAIHDKYWIELPWAERR